jgi:hypothetical protein
MNQDKKHSKPKAIYEPGELDRTRKNIGELDPEEAAKLTKILGGEIGVEKTPLYDEPNIKKVRTYAHRGDKIQKRESTKLSDQEIQKATSLTETERIAAAAIVKQNTQVYRLPQINSKEKNLMDKLMCSSEYRIKTNHGFFAFLILLARGNTERVNEDFILTNLSEYVTHFSKMCSAVKQLVLAGNDLFKLHVNESKDTKNRILFSLCNWNLEPLKEQYKILQKNAGNTNLQDLTQFIKLIYRMLLALYYYGDKNLTELFKTTYTEVAKDSQVKTELLLKYAKQAASEWLYLSGQAVKGMYPILMRMCSKDFVEFPDFFVTRVSSILQFLNITKYDLFLPEKKKKMSEPVTKVSEKPQEKTDIPDGQNKTQSETPQKKQAYQDDTIVTRGLELLDKLFPEAGWLKLQNHPDMYRYFQPLYNFKDGFNLLSKENPMQVTIVLISIIEDIFQACHNIHFTIDQEPEFSTYEDSLNNIFSEWSLYREAVFEKLYSSELKDYVNHLDTQVDFAKSPYAKKKLCNLLWQAKFIFLPHLSFELVFMEKPGRDTNYIPLPKRTDFLKKILTTLISRVDDYLVNETNSIENIPDFGVSNIGEHYRFEVPNAISKRLNYLLGGKKSRHSTNLNLLKYSLCIISVLDWWISDETSPAYSTPGALPYRALEDGKPVFSVPVINNPDELFLKHLKKTS